MLYNTDLYFHLNSFKYIIYTSFDPFLRQNSAFHSIGEAHIFYELSTLTTRYYFFFFFCYKVGWVFFFYKFSTNKPYVKYIWIWLKTFRFHFVNANLSRKRKKKINSWKINMSLRRHTRLSSCNLPKLFVNHSTKIDVLWSMATKYWLQPTTKQCLIKFTFALEYE